MSDAIAHTRKQMEANSQNSLAWYHFAKLNANLVRQWCETNTLSLVVK